MLVITTSIRLASYTVSITSPDKAKRSLRLSKGTAVIGREASEVVIDDPRCSSRHAELVFDGQSIKLRDLGSMNGTWYRGKRVTTLDWPRGESIAIGKYTLSLEAVEQDTGPGRTLLAGQTAYVGSRADEPTLSLPRATGLKLALRMKQSAVWLVPTLVLLLSGGVVAYKKLTPKPAPITVLSAASTTEPPGLDIRVATVSEPTRPDGPRVGHIRPARVRVGPNHGGGVSVGIMEDSVQGAGEQWRAATWLAAFNASRANRRQLGEQEFNVYVHGYIDGPSAGMLMTVAMIALMRGSAVRSDVTITGTINPDGTTGPVGCVVEKLLAANKHGIKRFGYPVGTGQQKRCNPQDRADGPTDIEQVARELGMTAKEIKSVEDAYQFATDTPLALDEQPISEGELAVLSETKQMLSIKMAAWKVKTELVLHDLKNTTTLNVAQEMFTRANADTANDYLAAALWGYADTCVMLSLGNRLNVLGKDIEPQLHAVERELKVFGDELELKTRPKTRAGQLNAAYALYTYANTWALMRTAQQLRDLARSDNPNAPDLSMMRRAAVYVELTHYYLDYARDVQDLARDESPTAALTDLELEQIVASYRAAAHASVSAFDSLVVEKLANKHRMPLERAKALWAYFDLDYAMASNALELADMPAPTPAKQLLRLAASSYAYLAAAKVLNTWDSLKATCGSAGAKPLESKEEQCANVSIPNRRALSEQLDHARNHARLAAGSARQRSFIPTGARLAYEQAAARREGTDSDKIDALLNYWESALWSDLASAQIHSAP